MGPKISANNARMKQNPNEHLLWNGIILPTFLF